MKKPLIKTVGELKKSGYQFKSVKQELRDNLIAKMQTGESTYPGIFGYQDTVIPDLERAILSRHNILFLGLRGQAKTRMARGLVEYLDEWIPAIEGSEINDDPLAPISKFAKDQLKQLGDETPVTWINRNERYAEKLATPDVSVADLIGDIDPIKAVNLKLNFADEGVIHYGIIPRSNRGIFVINELPDLQARIQVSLFNILEEGDLQIRGFKLRLPLDILFVFTANPEDYTNRGSIVTPLKDRIQSQILTHYPSSMEDALSITEQEAIILEEQRNKVMVHDLIKRLIEQIAIEARSSELVDKKSGVSARLTIAAFENIISTAERRSILNKEENTQVWLVDLGGIIPAITGKIELVYEGEQEGPYQVAVNLIDRAIRNQFLYYFPNPEERKKKSKSDAESPNPYEKIIAWFDQGNELLLSSNSSQSDRKKALNKIAGLTDLVKKYFPKATADEQLLWMEFVLFGLSAFSQISKKTHQGTTRFSDLMGSMLNFGDFNIADDESDIDF